MDASRSGVSAGLPADAGVAVGVDGSSASALAVRWAAEEAHALQAPLLLVHATAPLAPVSAGWPEAALLDGERLQEAGRVAGRRLLGWAWDDVRHRFPRLEVHEIPRDGDPREVLLEVAAGARMLVVGYRGSGTFERLLVGSVSATLADHAACPVVVVRPTPWGGDGVVTGVRGLGDAAVAELAADLAVSRLAELTVLTCYDGSTGAPRSVVDLPDLALAPLRLQLAVAEAMAGPDARHPGLRIERRASRADPAARLVLASQSAELVVVGHRRRHLAERVGELLRPDHGQVARAVLAHAACTVAVVPLADGDE